MELIFLVSTGGCCPWSFLVTKIQVIMFFDREAKAEAGMPPLVPAFPISMLMLYALCPYPQRENNYFIWSWYITI